MINLNFDEMRGHPLRPTHDGFIPFKGFENYKQSDLLKPWSKSTREKINFKTGLNFTDGTKGFPLELFYWLFKKHEFLFNWFFSTKNRQKLAVAAKGVLKTAFLNCAHLFLTSNFDFAHTIAMTKYNNAQSQVLKGLHGYCDLIENKTGLNLFPNYDWPVDINLNTRDFDIKLSRSWYKDTEIKNLKGAIKTKKMLIKKTNIFFRSFEKSDRIANFPKPKMGEAVILIDIIEPVMQNDPNTVSAQQIEDIWKTNGLTILRYATEANLYAQMCGQMNNWNQTNKFIEVAEIILPWSRKCFNNFGFAYRSSDDLGYDILRLARHSNELLKLSDHDIKERDIMEKENPELYEAAFWGGPYKMVDDENYPLRAAMANVEIVSFPEPSEFLFFQKNHKIFSDIFEPYFFAIGIDFGTNHATSVKADLFVPETGKWYRSHIWRHCNFETRRKNQTPMTIGWQIDNALNAIIEFLTPYAAAGVIKPIFTIWGDGGSRALAEITDDKIQDLNLENFLECLPSSIHDAHGRKAKMDSDNFFHSNGTIVYDPNDTITIEQYKMTKSKKNNPEMRDENNQLLDEIDAHNIAGEEIRQIAEIWYSMKIRQFCGKEN